MRSPRSGRQRLKTTALCNRPRGAAICGSVNSGSRAHHQVLRLGRVNDHAGQSGVVGQLQGEPGGLPRFAAIHRFEDTDAVRITSVPVARRDVHRVGVHGVDGDSANPQIWQQIGIRTPRSPVIGRLPQTTCWSSYINRIGFCGVKRDHIDPTNSFNRIPIERTLRSPLAEATRACTCATPGLLHLLHSFEQCCRTRPLTRGIDSRIHKCFPALELLPALSFLAGLALKCGIKFLNHIVHIGILVVPHLQPRGLLGQYRGRNRHQ